MTSELKKALVWIFRDGQGGPEVLLLERPARRGGGYHPVTGKAESDEADEETAAREAEEETGLRGRLVPLGFEHSFVDARGRRHQERCWLLIAPAGVPVRLSGEHVGSRWVPVAEARAALEWPAHREALGLAAAEFSKL